MEELQNGSAAENGDQNNGVHPSHTPADEDKGMQQPPEHREGGQAVPYSRFQEVNAKRKAAEETLASIIGELCEDVPEDMRPLIPNLPPVEKVRWLREARSKGLFSPAAPTASPDARRPTAKTSEDFTTLPPVTMMARGYN